MDGACVQRLIDLVEGCALDDHHHAFGCFGDGLSGGLSDAAGDCRVVLLDEDGVAEPEAVIEPAAGLDCALLELAQAGRRLTRVEDARLGAVNRVDVACGQRRHTRQPPEEVERHALTGQDRPRRAFDRTHRPPIAPLPLARERHEPKRLVDLTKDRFGNVDPGNDTGLLLIDPSPSMRVLGHKDPARDIPPPEVLRKRLLDQVVHGRAA